MDYKNNIFILRNIHKSNDEELIDYTFENGICYDSLWKP